MAASSLADRIKGQERMSSPGNCTFLTSKLSDLQRQEEGLFCALFPDDHKSPDIPSLRSSHQDWTSPEQYTAALVCILIVYAQTW